MSNWFSMYTHRELVLCAMSFAGGMSVVLIPITMRAIVRVQKRTDELKALLREIEARRP